MLDRDDGEESKRWGEVRWRTKYGSFGMDTSWQQQYPAAEPWRNKVAN